MKKLAQMYPGIDYGGGELAGYGQGGYHVSMDDPRLAQGSQMMPPEGRTKLPSWMLPAGVVGGGLAGLAALAALKRGKAPRGGKMPWNWDMEMLGRDGKKRYQSLVNPGETVGHGYGPGVEEVAAKIGSAPLRAIDIIRGLGTIAKR